MRVLYVDHPEADYTSAIVYLGLCQEIGPENVIDWPWKHTYHGQSYVGPVPYPPPGDHGIAHPFPWFPAQPGRPWSDDEVAHRIREFDLVVLASPRVYNTEAIERLIDRVGRASIRLVMLDGEDYTMIRWDYIDRFGLDRYFKSSLVPRPQEGYSNLREQHEERVKVRPMPFAAPIEHLEALPKSIDVCFLGGGSWQARDDRGFTHGPYLKAGLDEHLRRSFPSYVGGHVAYIDFLDIVRRSRVAVCVGGSGVEPLRTFEILSCPETMLARERLLTVWPNPLVEGATHVGFDTHDWDGLVETIRRYLNDEGARAQVARQGNAHLKAFHTPRARARQLLTEAF